MPHPLMLEANPGDIRYISSGEGENKKTIKQKYYVVKIDLGELQGPYVSGGVYQSGRPVIENRIKINAPEYEFYYKPINKFNNSVISILPDRYLDLSNVAGLINFINLLPNKSLVYKFTSYPKSDNYNFNVEFLPDRPFFSWSDYVDGLEDGTIADALNQGIYYYGQLYYADWASYSSVNDKQESTLPPGPLDKDWTLEEAIEKVQDLQFWADNNLLPPIFGPTNCVYFPSDLGDTKPTDTETARNPVIKSYPDNGLFYLNNQTTGTIDELYTHTVDFLNITGGKDETYEFICNIPQHVTFNRFSLIEDTFEGPPDNAVGYKPYPDYQPQKYKTKQLYYKPNQLVKLRFVTPESYADGNLIQEQKFNQYVFTGIIVSADLPEEKESIGYPSSVGIKSKLTIRLIQDYGLTKDKYFNAKVYLVDSQRNNFVQNETYSIKRYYKKDLGIGPRLGGSVMTTYTSDFDSEYYGGYYAPLYKFTSVLKDEEKLNKPCENVEYSGIFTKFSETESSFFELSHSFSKSDLGTQLEFLSNGPAGFSPEIKKQYIEQYSYLIKNLDEHDYEYYQKFKNKLNGLPLFYQSNKNANLTFGLYE